MTSSGSIAGWSREEMAARLAQDIPNGSYVNLGIGLPETRRTVRPRRTRHWSTTPRTVLIGMGPSPAEGEGDPELINAGKRQVTANPGAAFFHQRTASR
jgi:3-oxoadipate CoA-transferase beta subunit